MHIEIQIKPSWWLICVHKLISVMPFSVRRARWWWMRIIPLSSRWWRRRTRLCVTNRFTEEGSDDSRWATTHPTNYLRLSRSLHIRRFTDQCRSANISFQCLEIQSSIAAKCKTIAEISDCHTSLSTRCISCVVIHRWNSWAKLWIWNEVRTRSLLTPIHGVRSLRVCERLCTRSANDAELNWWPSSIQIPRSAFVQK